MRSLTSSGVPVAVIVLASLSTLAITKTRVRAEDTERAGQRLPSVAMYAERKGATQLADIVERNARTIILVFSPVCVEGVAEGKVWQSIARRAKADLGVVGLAYAPNPLFVSRLVADAGLQFPVWRIDRGGASELEADPMPAAFVVRRDLTIEFARAGPTASAELLRWLERTDALRVQDLSDPRLGVDGVAQP